MELPAEVGGVVRRLFGPKWLVTLCARDGEPQVSIAVPSIATTLRADGTIEKLHEVDFTSFGIPPHVRAIPPSPEDVVALVTRTTGARIASVPELVLPPPPYVAQLARWRITLDRPVPAVDQENGTRQSMSELYYGFGATWHATGFLRGEHVSVPRAVQDFQRGGASVPLVLKADYASRYTPLTVEKP